MQVTVPGVAPGGCLDIESHIFKQSNIFLHTKQNMTITNISRRYFSTLPRQLLTVLVCFCFFYVAYSNDLHNHNKLRRDGKIYHDALAHATYVSGFPLKEKVDDVSVELDLDAPAPGGTVLPFRTTSIESEIPSVIFSTTSTITDEILDENTRKNQEKINKLMLDMLAAGVGEGLRADENESDDDWLR